jgi:cytoskeletal protein CcmA (bactofilin family)
MSIWKELTNPSSFAGEYDTVIETPAPGNITARPNGPSPSTHNIESLIGPGVVFEGNVSGEGDMRIAGQIRGEVRLKGNLTLAAGARITGGVSANTVTIGGQVEGNVQSPGHVRLLETGQLIGDVKAKFLMAALGSRMRGHVEFGWDHAEAPPEAKRTPAVAANGTQPSARINPE